MRVSFALRSPPRGCAADVVSRSLCDRHGQFRPCAVARTAEPLVLPHRTHRKGETDIAFAASAVELDRNILLYYSVSDQYCIRAIIRRA